MKSDVLELGEAYFKAISEKDEEKIAGYVHPFLKFRSPLVESSTREEFLTAIRKLLANLKTVTIKSRFASENQAIFTYEMDFGPPIGTSRAANLMTFEGDKIKEIELFFDARPFEKLAGGPPRPK